MNSTTSRINFIDNLHCTSYRFAGLLLLSASMTNLFISFRYFYRRYCQERHRFLTKRLSHIIIGMLISSILVIFTGIPLVVLQCFVCQPYLAYEFICQIHGFMCFATGLFNMYIMALLSFFRYLSVLHKSSWLFRLLEEHRDASLLACGSLALAWALPPIFSIGTRFVREGTGFYCSLDWTNPSLHSRIFLILLISFNYFMPFILLVYSNVRVCCTLRRLFQSRDLSSYLFLAKDRPLSPNTCVSDSFYLQVELRKSLSDARLKETTNRLQRLKLDRRYTLITAMIAAQYLIAWTPYAFIEVLNITGHTTFIEQNPFIPTFCALFAKLTLILNPLILMYTSQMTQN